MNWDVDESRLQPGEYRYALNILNGTSRNGAFGAITNIKGNKEVANFSFPSGMEAPRVVAAFDDNKKNRVFFFVATVNNRHAIYYYDIISGEVVTVLEYIDTANKKLDTSVLGFNVNNVIPEVSIDIIYRQQGDLLCWTDGKTEPKKLNIDQAVRTTSSNFIGNAYDGTNAFIVSTGQIFSIDVSDIWQADNLELPSGELVYYFRAKGNQVVQDNEDNSPSNQPNLPVILDRINGGTIDNETHKVKIDFINPDKYELLKGGEVYPLPLLEEHITQMPKAPEEETKCRYSTSPSRRTNFLKDRLWQFRYKYVYDDDQESHWSPISEVPLNTETVFDSLPGRSTVRPNYFDNIIQTFNYVPVNSRVTSIKFAVRSGGSDNAKGDWQLVDEYSIRQSGNTFLVRNDSEANDPIINQAKPGSMGLTFSNDRTLTPIDITDVTQLYYNVPKRSEAQSLTEDNRLVHANITEGYDIDLSTLRVTPGLLNSSPLFSSHPLNGIEEENSVSISFTNKSPTPEGSGYYDSFDIEINDPNEEIEVGDLFEIDIDWFPAFRDRVDVPTNLYYDIKDHRFYPRQVRFDNPNTGHDKSSFQQTKYDAVNGVMDYSTNPIRLSGDTIRVVVTEQDFLNSGTSPVTVVLAERIAKLINDINTYVDQNSVTTYRWIDPYSIDLNDGLGDTIRRSFANNVPQLPSERFDFTQFAIASNNWVNSQRWYHAVKASHSGNIVSIENVMHVVSKNDCVGGNTISDIFTQSSNSAVQSFEFKTFFRLETSETQLEPRYTPRSRLLGRDGGSAKSLKRNVPQQYAIAFSDNFGRMSNAITTDAMGFTPQLSNDVDNSFSWEDNKNKSGAVYTELVLPHSIVPDWATHYHVLRVNNKPKRRFIQMCTSDSSTTAGNRNIFELVDFSGDTAADSVKIYLDVINGTGDRAFNKLFEGKSKLSYQYVAGDRVRFLYKIDTSSDDISVKPLRYYTSDVEILSYNAEDNSIIIPKGSLETNLKNVFVQNNVSSAEEAAGIMFEIYSTNPAAGIEDQEDSQLYYEIARTHPIVEVNGNKQFGISRTPIQFEEGAIFESSSPRTATLILEEGDVYFRPRLFNTDGSNLRVAWVEDENYSDFYESDFTNIGRPNLPFKTTNTRFIKSGQVKEVERISTMVWSEPLIPETNVNQIGTVFDTSVKDFNRIHGSINALVTKDFRVKIFFDDRVGWVMLGRQVFDDLKDRSLIGVSTGTISEIQYYSGEYGCVAPQSIEEHGNLILFADPKRGAICQLAENGIVEINNGMDTLFKKVFQDQYESEFGVATLAAYDKNNDMYVVNIRSALEQVDVSNKVSALPNTSIYRACRFKIKDIDNGQFETPSDLPPNYGVGATLEYSVDFLNGFADPIQRFYINDIFLDNQEWVIEVFIFKYDIPSDIPVPPGDFITYLRLPITNSKTLGYSLNLKKWVSFYSYSPDYLVNAGLGIMSFRGGKPYVHEATNNYARFYDTDYETFLQVVTNHLNSYKKIYKTAAINSPVKDVWNANTTEDRDALYDFDTHREIAPVETNIESVFDDPQDSNYKLPYQTRQLPGDFKYDEGMLYTAFNKNENEPDPQNPNIKRSNALKLGESEMRGNWLKMLLCLPKGLNRRVKLMDVIFKFALSDYNQKQQ